MKQHMEQVVEEVGMTMDIEVPLAPTPKVVTANFGSLAEETCFVAVQVIGKIDKVAVSV